MAKQPNVTPEEREQMRTLRSAGNSLTSIADAIGRSVSAVHAAVADIDVPRSNARTPPTQQHRAQITDEEAARMRKLRSQGRTITSIAAEFDRSTSAVNQQVKGVEKHTIVDVGQVQPAAPEPEAATTSIATAPQNWQRRWFATPQHRRDRIEEHLEHCQLSLSQIRRFDITDTGQHPMWSSIVKNSPWSRRDCARIIDLDEGTVGQYLSGKRTPSGTRNREVMTALIWNIAADNYHHHLNEMMWATYWAEKNEDAPTAITPDPGFTTWATTLSEHPLYQDLQHGIAHNPAAAIYPA